MEKKDKKERERENKVFPNVEDQIPGVRPPRTATIAQVREQSPNHRDNHGIGVRTHLCYPPPVVQTEWGDCLFHQDWQSQQAPFGVLGHIEADYSRSQKHSWDHLAIIQEERPVHNC